MTKETSETEDEKRNIIEKKKRDEDRGTEEEAGFTIDEKMKKVNNNEKTISTHGRGGNLGKKNNVTIEKDKNNTKNGNHNVNRDVCDTNKAGDETIQKGDIVDDATNEEEKKCEISDTGKIHLGTEELKDDKGDKCDVKSGDNIKCEEKETVNNNGDEADTKDVKNQMKSNNKDNDDKGDGGAKSGNDCKTNGDDTVAKHNIDDNESEKKQDAKEVKTLADFIKKDRMRRNILLKTTQDVDSLQNQTDGGHRETERAFRRYSVGIQQFELIQKRKNSSRFRRHSMFSKEHRYTNQSLSEDTRDTTNHRRNSVGLRKVSERNPTPHTKLRSLKREPGPEFDEVAERRNSRVSGPKTEQRIMDQANEKHFIENNKSEYHDGHSIDKIKSPGTNSTNGTSELTNSDLGSPEISRRERISSGKRKRKNGTVTVGNSESRAESKNIVDMKYHSQKDQIIGDSQIKNCTINREDGDTSPVETDNGKATSGKQNQANAVNEMRTTDPCIKDVKSNVSPTRPKSYPTPNGHTGQIDTSSSPSFSILKRRRADSLPSKEMRRPNKDMKSLMNECKSTLDEEFNATEDFLTSIRSWRKSKAVKFTTPDESVDSSPIQRRHNSEMNRNREETDLSLPEGTRCRTISQENRNLSKQENISVIDGGSDIYENQTIHSNSKESTLVHHDTVKIVNTAHSTKEHKIEIVISNETKSQVEDNEITVIIKIPDNTEVKTNNESVGEMENENENNDLVNVETGSQNSEEIIESKRETPNEDVEQIGNRDGKDNINKVEVPIDETSENQESEKTVLQKKETSESQGSDKTELQDRENQNYSTFNNLEKDVSRGSSRSSRRKDCIYPNLANGIGKTTVKVVVMGNKKENKKRSRPKAVRDISSSPSMNKEVGESKRDQPRLTSPEKLPELKVSAPNSPHKGYTKERSFTRLHHTSNRQKEIDPEVLFFIKHAEAEQRSRVDKILREMYFIHSNNSSNNNFNKNSDVEKGSLESHTYSKQDVKVKNHRFLYMNESDDELCSPPIKIGQYSAEVQNFLGYGMNRKVIPDRCYAERPSRKQKAYTELRRNLKYI